MKRTATRIAILLATGALIAACGSVDKAAAAEAVVSPPMYPAWPSAEAEDISQNAYGTFTKTPRAPKIGQKVAAFVAPTTDDKGINLARDVADGPIVAVFYRGFW
ncbi:MAG: hypothetical protein ACI9MR_001145 [Myxococcota bacterium]|jgi:hypothetical protein